MYLKRLDISGFKSFAGKSVLDFEKGHQITSIVGPNGSGKSNIADSIRWVLGETSYKTVRAKKSEDVIFSGSNGKARASFAKVAMILDNSDGKAPIDFSEVEIARSVYRDGSSEYLINGKKSRLLDVAELLARSGFGQSTYSVIGQGMVDSMLFYGPAERKVLFDEAAGVRQYEMKREQTLRKLEETHSNVTRAKDILSELNPRLNTLKKQAEKAKEKDVVKASLNEKQKTYFATVWDKLISEEKSKRADLERLLAEEEKVNNEISQLDEAFNNILNKEKLGSAETEKIQKEINDLEIKKDNLRQEIYTLRAKMELTFSAPTQKELDKKISEEKKKLEGVNLSGVINKKEEIEAELKKFQENGYIEKITQLESQKEEIFSEIYRLKAQLEVQSAENSLTKSEISSQISVLNAEIKNLDIEKIIQSKEEIEKNEHQISSKIEKINKEIEEKRKNLSLLSEELSKFDFSVVGQRIGKVLSLQNSFITGLTTAKDKSDIEKLRKEAEKITEKLAELQLQVSDVKEGRISGMSETQDQLEKLTNEKDKFTEEYSLTRNNLNEKEYELRKANDDKRRFEYEIEKLSKLKPIDKNDKKEIANKIETLEKRTVSLNIEINNIKLELEKEASYKNQIIGLDFEIKREEEKKKDIDRSIEHLINLKPADEGEKVEIQNKITEKESEIEKINTNVEDLRIKINERSSTFDSQGQKLSEIKDGLTSKQALASEYTKELTTTKIELARIETKKQDIKEEIVYEMGSEAALAGAQVVPEIDEEASRRELERLKTKLYAIGEIDPEVETEYVEVNARAEFLSKQTDDLEKAKNDLEELISELDTKIKKQFENSFTAISQKFEHFFTLLFDGGEAKLELVKQKADDEEGEDKFGIEITAVPPGKKVKSLSALSGGERTLTSLALLFAILSVNPAPFCVLDEVDAALDETNTKKFLKIVKELTNGTQFIFISHNRETMKEASIIYGITMDESHASKILSVKLTDALEVVNKKVSHPERKK